MEYTVHLNGIFNDIKVKSNQNVILKNINDSIYENS